MQNLQQALRGILTAIIALSLMLGIFSISLAEGKIPTIPIIQISSPTGKPTITKTPSLTGTSTSSTATLTPSTTICPVPVGWTMDYVQEGDTLFSLAQYYKVSSEELMRANCLTTFGLVPGAMLFVPSIPSPTAIPCGPPSHWIPYRVQFGDTLYHLSHNYSTPISVSQLQTANCLGSSTRLYVGQLLYLPPWPTITPTPTFPPFSTPTFTNTPITPTVEEITATSSTLTATLEPSATYTLVQ
jgi:LysM repeat protein